MNSSDNFGLNLPEQIDSYDVEHMNENTRAIDTLLNERMAVKTITVDKNLNTMRESGIYFLSQNNTHTNMPPNCTNGWLIVMNNAGNIKQIFLRRGSSSTHSNAYSRLLSGTGDLIGDWVRYLSELELGALTNLDLDPQATDVVQALNDLYSYCVNQFANKNHTHNYAGSSSAGGSATSAVKLQTARTIRTNLASTSTASFDGTANVTPGVTGVLPVANGGTGQTTLANAEKALLTSLNTSDDALIESGDYIPVLTQSGGGGVSSYIATKRSPSTFWDYIVNKISVNLGLTSTTYGGRSANASNAEKATKLSTSRTIRTNLASTSTASFDGTANVTPGVTGTLPVANGGTGQTNLNAGANAFINSLDTGTATPVGDAYFVSQDASGGNINTYFRRPISKIWDYIKNQIGTKGSATQPVYMNAGVPTACTYTLGKSVPSNAVFTDTNTWRPVQNNLTSTSTSDCLSANQGRILKGLIDGKPINTVESECLTSTTSVSHNGAILTYTLTFTGTYIILIYLSNNSTGGAWFGTGSAISDSTNVAYGTVSPGGTLMKILTITKTTTVGIWNETGSTKSYGCGTCFCAMRV